VKFLASKKKKKKKEREREREVVAWILAKLTQLMAYGYGKVGVFGK
jgi:hypothetical protein